MHYSNIYFVLPSSRASEASKKVNEQPAGTCFILIHVYKLTNYHGLFGYNMSMRKKLITK